MTSRAERIDLIDRDQKTAHKIKNKSTQVPVGRYLESIEAPPKMNEIEKQSMHRSKSYRLAIGLSSHFSLETIGKELPSNLKCESIEMGLGSSIDTARKQNIKKRVDFV